MKAFLEVICFPVTFLIWILSFVFILFFSLNVFKKAQKENKSFIDIFYDINYIVYRTYVIDFYFSMNLYLRSLIIIIIYYTLFF